MSDVLHIMLIIHIASGFIALVTGFISMLNRKGGKQHRLTGKIFFIAMTGVFITSVYISIVKNLAFLFMVAFFSYHMACSGYRILYLKKLHTTIKPNTLDWIISITGLTAGTGLIVFSIYWFAERGPWGFVPLVFGITSSLNSIRDISSYFNKPQYYNYWLTKHGARMGGSFAATLTAFVVVNVDIGNYSWILWILPGVLAGIWISETLKKYKKNQHIDTIGT